MKSESYWERRAVEDAFHAFETAEAHADEISKLYFQASRRLAFEIRGLYEKYKSNNGLSDAEAKRLLAMLHDPTDIKEAIRLLDADPNNKDALELKDALESAAFQRRIYRLQLMQTEIDGLMQSIYGQEFAKATAAYAEIADDAFYREIYNIQQRAGEAFQFSHLSKNTVDGILKHNWSGLHYSKRIWRNTQDLGQQLKEEILLGTLSGKTEWEMSQTIMERFSVGSIKARRLVRTESAYVFNEMNARADQEAGFDRYRYLATLDLRTSEICRELDGKEFAYKDKKAGVNYPPMHPWCRSTTIYAWDPAILAKMKRRAWDPEKREYIKVPANMTYKEWYRKFVLSEEEKEE